MTKMNRKWVGGAVVTIGLLGAYYLNIQSGGQNQLLENQLLEKQLLENEVTGLEETQQLPSNAQLNVSLPTAQSLPPDVPGRGSTLFLPEIAQEPSQVTQLLNTPDFLAAAHEQIFVDYHGMFSQLNLDSEVESEVQHILAQKLMLNLFAVHGSSTEFDSNMPAYVEQRTAELREVLSSILSTTELETVQYFMNSQPERIYIRDIVGSSNEQADLTEEQSELLIQMLYEERINNPGLANIQQAIAGSPLEMSNDELNYLERLSQDYDNRVEEIARSVLTDEQMQIVFSNH